MHHYLLAQTPIGNFELIGPLGNRTTYTNTFSMFETLISNVLGLLTILAGLYFFFQIILAGYNWISAGGDKQAVQNAQKKVSNAVLGLIIIVLAYVITGVLSRFLGLNILFIGDVLTNLHP
jgi:hypothetical protein